MKASLDILANLEYNISGISIFFLINPYEDIYGLRFFFVEFEVGEMCENIWRRSKSLLLPFKLFFSINGGGGFFPSWSGRKNWTV